MQILASLREVLTQSQAWWKDYGELIAALSSVGGHMPAMAAKESQVDPRTTGCAYADDLLLPCMRQHGRLVDQEVFGASER